MSTKSDVDFESDTAVPTPVPCPDDETVELEIVYSTVEREDDRPVAIIDQLECPVCGKNFSRRRPAPTMPEDSP